MEKRWYFQQMVLDQLDISSKTTHFNSYLVPHTKININWKTDIKVKGKNLGFLRNIEKHFFNLGLSKDFLDRTPQA